MHAYPQFCFYEDGIVCRQTFPEPPLGEGPTLDRSGPWAPLLGSPPGPVGPGSALETLQVWEKAALRGLPVQSWDFGGDRFGFWLCGPRGVTRPL